jgi:hypothetical protein
MHFTAAKINFHFDKSIFVSQTILIGNLSCKLDAKCSRELKTFSTSAKNSKNKNAKLLLKRFFSLFFLSYYSVFAAVTSPLDSLSQISLYSFSAKVCHHGKFDRYYLGNNGWYQLSNDFTRRFFDDSDCR